MIGNLLQPRSWDIFLLSFGSAVSESNVTRQLTLKNASREIAPNTCNIFSNAVHSPSGSATPRSEHFRRDILTLRPRQNSRGGVWRYPECWPRRMMSTGTPRIAVNNLLVILRVTLKKLRRELDTAQPEIIQYQQDVRKSQAWGALRNAPQYPPQTSTSPITLSRTFFESRRGLLETDNGSFLLSGTHPAHRG